MKVGSSLTNREMIKKKDRHNSEFVSISRTVYEIQMIL